MEHTLGGTNTDAFGVPEVVLILVLVEHTLGVLRILRLLITQHVLILVLVEHTLGGHGGKHRAPNRWTS